MWWRRLAEVQTEHQNGEERGFKWLWTWNGCWCRRTGLSISTTADLLGFSHTIISSVYREWSEKERISSEQQLCGWKCLVDVRGQRRMGRLVRDDRKTTVTLITTRYNQGMQNTISEHTTRRTLKQMGSSSRRPHRCRSGQIRTGHGGAHFWPLKTNWASVKRHSLPEYCCWPGSSLYYIYIAIGQFTNGSSQWTFNSILINAAKKIKCSFFFIWANSVLSCGPHKWLHPL